MNKVDYQNFQSFAMMANKDTSVVASARCKKAVVEELAPFRFWEEPVMGSCSWNVHHSAIRSNFKNTLYLYFVVRKTTLLSKSTKESRGIHYKDDMLK